MEILTIQVLAKILKYESVKFKKFLCIKSFDIIIKWILLDLLYKYVSILGIVHTIVVIYRNVEKCEHYFIGNTHNEYFFYYKYRHIFTIKNFLKI